MNTPTPARRSPAMAAMLERHSAAPPPVLPAGRLLTAPGNPAAPRADASARPAPRPDGTRTASGGGMTRSEALAIVRRMMREAARPRLSIRVLVPLGAAPSLLQRLHKVTDAPPAASARSLLERLERVTAPRPRPAA